MKQGDWFDGPNKLEQLARELLWFPGMTVLELGPSLSSFELAKLLRMKLFHLEMSAEQMKRSQTLAAKLELNTQAALWEEREQALREWPPIDALVLRNVCGIPMEELKKLLSKLSCPGSLLLAWPVRLQKVSELWEKAWEGPLWTPNELLYELRGLGFESMYFECQPFVPQGQSSKALHQELGAQEGITERDLLLTAYALVAATLLAEEGET
ncbi:MAG: hypothetical protein FWG75_08210 [Cystobacterineae bacterium]|nr:hypothetical protein [Cystobacterineae bacterium]